MKRSRKAALLISFMFFGVADNLFQDSRLQGGRKSSESFRGA